MAGEEPRRAWALAALAVVVLIVARLIGGVLSSLAMPGLFGVIEVLFGLSTAGWVLLLVAFLLGLPSPGEAAAGEPIEPAPTADPPAATPPGSAAG
jgi:hypothetical protein